MRIAPFLRPTGAWCGCLNGQHLARSCRVSRVRRTTPFVRHQEQRSVVHAPEHASEAAAVKVDRLQHLTALANAHAMLVADVRVPDGVFRIEANAVWEVSVEVGPNSPVRQALRSPLS